MSNEFSALDAIVLKSVFSPDDIWSDEPVHVDGLHVKAWQEISRLYRTMKAGDAIDNIVVQGMPGAGKTHLLGQLRKHVVRQDDIFVYFQMNSVDQIWQGLVLAYIEAMERASRSHQTQTVAILEAVAAATGKISSKALRELQESEKADQLEFAAIRREFGRFFGISPQARDAADVAFALLLNSSADYNLQNLGYSFLISADLAPGERNAWGFLNPALQPRQIVRAMDRIVASTGKVTVLAVDQLDGLIATACHAHDKKGEDAALLDEIANALMDISELTTRTLIVISSLLASWTKIEGAVPSASQRYPHHIPINLLPSAEVGMQIVAQHFDRGFLRAGFTPPYPTWPVKAEAFNGSTRLTSRELLNRVDEHVTKCRNTRQIVLLSQFEDPEPTPALLPNAPTNVGAQDKLDRDFEEARKAARVDSVLDERRVDAELPPLLREGLAAWIDENGDRNKFSIDPLFGRSPPLHVRLRQLIDPGTEEERHWAFRAIVNTNATACLNRLRAATTQSALSLGAQRRQLVILRNAAWSSGPKTQEVVHELKRLGGVILPISLDDLAIFSALGKLRKEHGDLLVPWLRDKRPASVTTLFRSVFACEARVETKMSDTEQISLGLRTNVAAVPVPTGPAAETTQVLPPREQPSERPRADLHKPAAATALEPLIRLGSAIDSGRDLMLKLEDLRRHMAIFAGSGSGKTVLIRRIVEECALLGVSSIVLDPNNDLARLGTPWPEQPVNWSQSDPQRAARYFEETEVVVYTPRRAAGRPLNFKPLGDLHAVKDDIDEFDVAIDNAVATIFPRAGLPATGGKQEQGRAVLKEALIAFVKNGGDGLGSFLEFLSELPPGTSRLANSEKLAHDIAQTLIAATVNDPMFGGEGEAVDPGVLLTPRPGKKARVSVISLIGLPNDDQRQSFVNQLQMALFSWTKRNPAGDRPLGGLFVMDEAQTFAPSGPATPCTAMTLTLASQARKYGLGLIFATQAPKGLHNRIPGNATTQIYGFLNAPVQIEAAREMARAKGGDVPDISRLTVGQFYVASDKVALQKVATPLCLSHHPKSPLTQLEILALACAE